MLSPRSGRGRVSFAGGRNGPLEDRYGGAILGRYLTGARVMGGYGHAVVDRDHRLDRVRG